MLSSVPTYKDVVLVGGGHSHVEVLRRFGMKPLPGVRLTLVTPNVLTPYSGMLPGYVSGFYTLDDCHIDLYRLARYASARLITTPASSIDTANRKVFLCDSNRPPLSYDVLSINVGITPTTSTVPGAAEYTVPVKPISTFSDRFQELLSQAATESSLQKELRVAVVGGGAGGVELACALRYRLVEERKGAIASTNRHQVNASNPPGGSITINNNYNDDNDDTSTINNNNNNNSTDSLSNGAVSVSLISQGPILSQLSSYARNAFVPLLQHRDIHLYETQGGVASVTPSCLSLKDGTTVPFDVCLWCTQAGAAPWLAGSGLPTDEKGFMLVNEFLQSDGGPENVFGAGDIVTMRKHPRPKAGVYAVRAGPYLADNIMAHIQGTPYKQWIPQSTHLNIITTGDKYAIATKGWFGAQGTFLWKWKDRIDRSFMDKYGAMLTSMITRMMDQESVMMPSENTMPWSFLKKSRAHAADITSDRKSDEVRKLIAAAKMRCGGCGAKVGATTLDRVLQRLRADSPVHGGATLGLSSPDDAAVLPPPPPGCVTIHTVDFFKQMVAISDPYTFGAIAATHALSDCYAMGAAPAAALAIAVLPFASAEKTEDDLYQLMSGAMHVLTETNCELVGGHTCEGTELSLGLSVYGVCPHNELMRRSGLCAGDKLIVTKPLGIGIILAAAARGKGVGKHLVKAIDIMLTSNREAAAVLKAHGATACVDVTGFGLLGHLAEMAKAGNATVEVNFDALPVLDGVVECLQDGIMSSLYEENARVAAVVKNAEMLVEKKEELWSVAVDPQTSGGLLAGVPAEKAEGCVEELKKKGYLDAKVIGTVLSVGDGCWIIPD